MSDVKTPLELISEIKALLTEYYKHTQDQLKFIDQGDTDELEKSFSARQGIIDKIEVLHQDLNFLMQSYKRDENIIHAEEDLQAELKRILGQEEQNVESSKLQLKRIRGEAKKVSLERKSFSAYNQVKKFSSSEYFDKKS